MTEPFTTAEAHFFKLLGEIDDLPPYPDEPEVNFIPRGRLKQLLWEAVQSIRMEDREKPALLPPYPFCRTPNKCAGKGYCLNDPACNN